MSDLISRQAAIDATWFEPSYTDPLNVLTEVRDRLKALPSAQPQDAEEDIRAMCGECDAWNIYKNYPQKYLSSHWIPAVEGLLSAQPERKKGKWNTYYHGDFDFSYSCNKCGYSAPYQMIGSKVFQKKWNFCPNCGADMRG